MKKIKIHTPDTFSKLMAIVEKYQNSHDITWFRGAGSPTHALRPGLFRHRTVAGPEALNVLERDISLSFSQKSPPFVSQSFRNDWEKMFFMQHYGIPTRLLDWSESPLVAAYFALTNCRRDTSGAPLEIVSVWLLDPVKWNQSALADISYTGGVLDPEREQAKGYSPSVDLAERKNLPVMIYGTHNSARIVAQRGMFALFGKSTDPMEAAYLAGSGFMAGTLERIDIPVAAIDNITKSLFRNGVADSTVFPDISGLALEIRRIYGF